MNTLNPFAGVEALINQSVGACLANAVAIYNGGPAFGVLLDRGYTDQFSGVVDSTRYTVSLDLAYAPDLAEGAVLVISGIDYCVGGAVAPDTSGWATVPVYPVV
ncbi:MAG: hypothetical protein PHX60_13385 [Giesbergeria sp.]|uniref:hypothetical protein n=1 Tax=Giesbergeria sp. TaxID=2818473 RepID=UPI002606E67C|nr:hypothetical protein [Giesbergeria sp.]MDD2610653.1 hypothetical protein [Giesbergeria sp.]